MKIFINFIQIQVILINKIKLLIIAFMKNTKIWKMCKLEIHYAFYPLYKL